MHRSAPRPAYRVTDPVAQEWLALGKLKFALGKLARTQQRQKGEKALTYEPAGRGYRESKDFVYIDFLCSLVDVCFLRSVCF